MPTDIQLSNESINNLGPALEMSIAETMIFKLDRSNVEQFIGNIDNRFNWLMSELKRLKKLRDERLIEILKENPGQSIQVDDYRYIYLGTPKETSMRDGHDQALYEDLLKASGGDESAVIRCLACGWAKQGACKRLFEECKQPELFEKHFEVTKKETLENGKLKPAKELITAFSRFSR